MWHERCLIIVVVDEVGCSTDGDEKWDTLSMFGWHGMPNRNLLVVMQRPLVRDQHSGDDTG